MIERRLGLVVRPVVALVYHDQADVRQRGEKRRARPDDDLEQPESGAPPGIVAFAFGEPRVDQSHLPRETHQKTAHGLRGEGNLRDEDDGLLAAPDGFLRGADVDFGLAGAGDSVEKEGIRVAG